MEADARGARLTEDDPRRGSRKDINLAIFSGGRLSRGTFREIGQPKRTRTAT